MLGVVKGVKTEKCNIMILISQRSSTDIKTVLTMTLAPLFTSIPRHYLVQLLVLRFSVFSEVVDMECSRAI